jgi:hypothetical protein
MAHYAFLDQNNIVTEVITGRDEWEEIDGVSDWEKAYSDVRGQVCKRTSYNAKIRGVYAGIGYSYNEAEDIFVQPQPYPSWIRNGSFWQAPIAIPDNDNDYHWNEEEGAWNVIS